MPKRPNIAAVFKKSFSDSEEGKSNVHPLRNILKDENAARVLVIPIEQIEPNPDQPRKFFDPEAMNDLASSVREKGILQPIIVRKKPGSDACIIIAGERRWRAAKIAGLKEIPALVRSDTDAREVAIIENLQRENLNPIEEAEALLALKTERGYTDNELAKIVGKSRPTITEILSLTALPEAVRAECRSTDKWTKTQLLQLLRAGSATKIEMTWEGMKRGEATSSHALRDRNRVTKGTAERPHRYEYQYAPEDKTFRLSITFRKSRASRDEIRAALKVALKELRD